ncbi:hypothetical protein [Viridibacillus arvi]|uniref:hypothetical protein n=1 Tax=Viridibacillus arvi TaxID=263475 RepID=UPI0034CEF6BE
MTSNFRKELQLIIKVGKEHNIPYKTLQSLIETSKSFTYDNVSEGKRLDEYMNLINFAIKNEKGE